MVAQLTRARGNKGEIAAVTLSDHPERIKRAYVNGTPLDVERVWWHDGRLIFKFAGVDSISAAEALAGLDVCIPADERAPLPPVLREAVNHHDRRTVGRSGIGDVDRHAIHYVDEVVLHVVEHGKRVGASHGSIQSHPAVIAPGW